MKMYRSHQFFENKKKSAEVDLSRLINNVDNKSFSVLYQITKGYNIRHEVDDIREIVFINKNVSWSD
jgi:hypothetical protein